MNPPSMERPFLEFSYKWNSMIRSVLCSHNSPLRFKWNDWQNSREDFTYCYWCWKHGLCAELNLQFSCSVVSNSLRPHGLQHARLPCPSPTPRACSNSCQLSRWCHATISSLNLQELNLGWVLGQVEKNSFIALPSKRGYSWPLLSNTVS